MKIEDTGKEMKVLFDLDYKVKKWEKK